MPEKELLLFNRVRMLRWSLLNKLGNSKRKSKRVTVAIAKASPTGETAEVQSQTPRKRGRPRKIVERTVSQEEKGPKQEEEAVAIEEGVSKRLKSKAEGEEEEEELQQQDKRAIGSSSSISLDGSAKGQPDTSKSKEPPRSRGRRKSQPRKSS
ncbi:PREDICTED: nucleoporin NUP159-like [Nelumbo nucifera]|uniref:Uncharacterized protein n=2 Tax=Nelumbo nucifera TaxID=4432 RepID=A0A822XMQ7_NELNU|nr:PREDICTED: nucleoporin NUP159-like [Nelumbo nucifera]DAD21660.1 TPA_asm: hypothetical protein HUJ06_023123 [Nelumbo nucifera]